MIRYKHSQTDPLPRKTPALADKVCFDKLITLFVKASRHRFILPATLGKGNVLIFNLEKGLQACLWDCCFNKGMEIYSDVSCEIEDPYFTLAFFLNMRGLRFANETMLFKENTIWDAVFISAASDYKIYIAPMARGHCLSINFSKKWFEDNVVACNNEFKFLKEKIRTTKPFLLLESLNQFEKKLVEDLFDASWEKPFGFFYIKSSVLTIVSDFFSAIKGTKTFSYNTSYFDPIDKVGEYLNNHLTGTLPNLKDLAHKFSMSESTLKRQFKKRYGINMTSYFIHKKMEYTQHLIHEKNMTITEIASLLGYRNISHFVTVFKKYQESLN